MRAVWSFWSAPYRGHYHANWGSERSHLMAWVLSVGVARRHFAETRLVTDADGRRLLVDGLGLRFDAVETGLDALARDDTGWWVLGKLAAYAMQEGPFLHLDCDVFLWAGLPAAMRGAAVVGQNPEFFEFHDQSLYRLDAFLAGIGRHDGWLPAAWRWFAEVRGNRAVCCGILGGADAGFLREYAAQAMAVIRHPANQAVWPGLGVRDNILVEQYFLAAWLEHHRREASYLFESSREAFDPARAARAGYTHLIGEAKRNPEIAARLERRVLDEFPAEHARCLAVLAEGGWR